LKLADKAQYDPYFNLRRAVQGTAVADPNLPGDRQEMNAHPYLTDLARLGALIPLSPWREPQPLKEVTEQFRERIKDYINLYRNGLGTVNALRQVTEAEMPLDFEELPARRDRSFSIEENVRLVSTIEQFRTRGRPNDVVGPLMRWDFSNEGTDDTPVTAYIRAAVAGEVDAVIDPATNPMLELFAGEAGRAPIGIAYEGAIAPGKTLRLSPSYVSWLFGATGLLQAVSLDDDTASHAWQTFGDLPVGVIRCLHQSSGDKMMWLALENGGHGELWRFDGREWLGVNTALPLVHCLYSTADKLMVGTADGLLCISLFSADAVGYSINQVAATSGVAVFDLLVIASGTYWLASDDGIHAWDELMDTVSPVTLQGTAIRCLAQDRDGVIYAGGDLGVFQHHAGADIWYWYRGEESSDQIPDWNKLEAGNLPQAAQVFLPPVKSIHVGPDRSLWIGTDHGLARYVARLVGGYTYTTLLEAYPDLLDTGVHAIHEDCRGMVWFCTGRGLFRFDGRDLAQYAGGEGAWLSCGRADKLYQGDHEAIVRPAFRFDREESVWKSFNNQSGWESFPTDLRSNAEQAVHGMLWTDSVVAEIGTWDGETFEHESDVPQDSLHLRCKPEPDRIINAGLVCMPRMPTGVSTWRYLSMETDVMSIPAGRPWWSAEGRLFPDPEADAHSPYPGRHRAYAPSPKESEYDQVFAYKPAAEVWLQWRPRKPLSALVRLQKRKPSESIHPALLDRVWQGIQYVRPVGVNVLLAVENEIVKGEMP